ncbi:MAG TPA: cohesin domain-containing protein [Candidatus Polarisedimenticolia bacterium]|nr:cohesin domain-containing protein [Candidatus Polarisedimenticolia bacterium]
MLRSSGRTTRARSSGWSVALALATILLGCSSGGDESINSTPCSNMEFAGANATPVNGDIFLQEASTIYSTCSSIDVRVVINNLNDIYTVGFDLTYPSTLVSYTGFTLGPLLQQGNPINTPLAVVNLSSGSLNVAVTRFDPDPSVDAVGQQVLMTLHFSRQSTGAAMIDFNLSGGSPVSELIQDENQNVRPAIFGPGHGGLLTVPL